MRYINAVLEGVTIQAAAGFVGAVKLPSANGAFLASVSVDFRRTGTSEYCSMYLVTATDPTTPAWVTTNAYLREVGRTGVPVSGTYALPAGMAAYSGHGASAGNAPTSPVTFLPFSFQTLAGARVEPKIEALPEFEAGKLLCLYNRDVLSGAILADVILGFQIVG